MCRTLLDLQDILYDFCLAGFCYSLGNVTHILPPVYKLEYIELEKNYLKCLQLNLVYFEIKAINVLTQTRRIT